MPLTNLYRDETLDGARLPKERLCAHTACFRRGGQQLQERHAQADPEPSVQQGGVGPVCPPGRRFGELETLTAHAGDRFERLALPHRVVALCTGDLSFSAAKTYDLELMAAGRNEGRGAYRDFLLLDVHSFSSPSHRDPL